MDKIRGVNLGNWLVLEKWMNPEFFEDTGAEDEVWLNRLLTQTELQKKMKIHRDSYITENDFAELASHGILKVRIPVPYFVFGDRPPFVGCISYLDKAFFWAEKYGMQILIDLHTVPGSQNGYDNGGITGVCKWHKNSCEVEFVLTVLERLAERYGAREGLWGIEVLNEPISLSVYLTAPSRGKARDKKEAKGSGYVPMKFLKEFYEQAYQRIRVYLPDEKAIVFHDGFRIEKWNTYFKKRKMKNVYLDTHIYIFAMENFIPFANPWIYRGYIALNKWKIEKTKKVIPVIVGEWCICNRYADRENEKNLDAIKLEKIRRSRFAAVYKWQKDAWEASAGWFYWNYKILHNVEKKMDESWKESWDIRHCFTNKWIPENINEG